MSNFYITSSRFHNKTIPPKPRRLLFDECLQRLRRAVDEFVVDGVKTTLPLFQRLIKDPDVVAGDYDIHWLEQFLKDKKA